MPKKNKKIDRSFKRLKKKNKGDVMVRNGLEDKKNKDQALVQVQAQAQKIKNAEREK